MFGKRKKPSNTENKATSPVGPIAWDIPIFFGILFVLSIAELCFSVFSFQHLERHNEWYSGTEKARIGFLIFSSARTIILSAGYVGSHFARKHFHSMMHTIFLVISTILWIISGVLIHTMYGYFECGGIGQPEGGISECHTTKIVEILAWVLAAVSVVATVPVVMNASKRKKAAKDSKSEKNGSRV